MSIVEELRTKKSEYNRKLLDRAADRIEELEASHREQSEVVKEIIQDIAKACALKDFESVETSIGYATAMNTVLDALLEIKQKYTEGE